MSFLLHRDNFVDSGHTIMFSNFCLCIFQWNHKQCFSDLLLQNTLQHIDIHCLFGSQNVMMSQKINQVQAFVLLAIAIEKLFLTGYTGTYIRMSTMKSCFEFRFDDMYHTFLIQLNLYEKDLSF